MVTSVTVSLILGDSLSCSEATALFPTLFKEEEIHLATLIRQ